MSRSRTFRSAVLSRLIRRRRPSAIARAAFPDSPSPKPRGILSFGGDEPRSVCSERVSAHNHASTNHGFEETFSAAAHSAPKRFILGETRQPPSYAARRVAGLALTLSPFRNRANCQNESTLYVGSSRASRTWRSAIPLLPRWSLPLVVWLWHRKTQERI